MQIIEAYRLKIMHSLSLLLIMVCSCNFAFAQSAVITGVVNDIDRVAILGATVTVKDTQIGTITDANGNFSLRVPNPAQATLQVSYIGFESVEVQVHATTHFTIELKAESTELDQVTVVAYGVQKKETLTGAISSVGTDELLVSSNASIANSLAGKITGLSSVQSSGQPGAEDPSIYIRGGGSLTTSGSTPLMLVDGVERSFFQMDPNEIESITVLKDASATAVFGVRGANGVILVTTRSGEKGKAKVSYSSSFGLQTPTRVLEMADSYTYATMHNEMSVNDGRTENFSDYVLERFKLGDESMLYPSIDWFDYMTNDVAVQTQHNINVSGGTDKMKYFISAGYLFQDGLFKDFGKDNLGYSYNRYNYRTNIDYDISSSTVVKLGIGGVVGDQLSPYNTNIWTMINSSQPFSSPGIIDGDLYVSQSRYTDVNQENPLYYYYGKGYQQNISNTMNMDLSINQKLDFVVEGLSFEVKGAYNTNYSYIREVEESVEYYVPYYLSEVDGSNLSLSDPDFDKTIVTRVNSEDTKPDYSDYSTSRGRDWYLEASLRYAQQFGDHNVTGLLLYNQDKSYYPSQYSYLPTAYVGLVGRVTYDYQTKYMAEINVGYNGSENFAPDQRYGLFPSLSVGYIITQEEFMKSQNIFDYLKIRASVGLVGNDNMQGNRFLYLPDSYSVNQSGTDSTWSSNSYGYNFGYNSTAISMGTVENRIGNENVTWETVLKQNYGIDMAFLNNRLSVNADYFREYRKNILITRNTISSLSGLNDDLLPVVNMGEVKNHGCELAIEWKDRVGQNFNYYINGNMSYARNEIIYQDEVEPNEPYMRTTGQAVGTIFGYVAEGLYSYSDFKYGDLLDGLPEPESPVYPGDVKYADLNNDGYINSDDVMKIGYSTTPEIVFGLNIGATYKGFNLSMNWTGATNRSLVLSDEFRSAFDGENRGLMQFHVDTRWTPETASTAEYPRLSINSDAHNSKLSSLWVKDGSYLKLKNVVFGYTFSDGRVLKKIGASKLALNFTGYNILTFDHFDIMDPESNPDRYGHTYPVVKNYTLGVNIIF